jgi:hypothetical protein
MDRLTSRELQAFLATLRTLYGIHTPTAFASALVQALPRLIAVDHVVYAEVRASLRPQRARRR